MSTRVDFIDYLHEQVGLGDRLSSRKMFGEFAVYVDGKVVALACDNSLFIKPTAAAEGLDANLPRLSPYPGARLHVVVDALLDEPDALRRLLLATAALLPEPKPKKATKKTRKKTNKRAK